MNSEDPFDQGLLIALRALKASDKTEAEIRSRLAGRGIDADAVERIIQHLKVKKFLSEERVVEETLRVAGERRKEGKLKLLHRLEQRGVDPQLKEQAEIELDPEIELAKAISLLTKRYKPSDKVEKGALHLARKGFEEETVREACERFFDRTDDHPL
ncbi:MAG: regulatory protein RecX [Fimbriimonadaceae bacterium]